MFRFFVLFGVFALAACGAVEWPPSPGSPFAFEPPRQDRQERRAAAARASGPVAPAIGTITVARGESVYSIARRHGVSPRELIQTNALRPPFRLSIGQRLRLPAPSSHVVRPGENLWAIADAYDVDRHHTARLNRLSPPYVIHPGQRIYLPRPVAVAKAPAAKTPAVRGTAVRTSSLAPPKPLPPRATSTPPATRAAARTPVPPPASRDGFVWPVEGKVITGFGKIAKGLHNDGINIAAPRGTPVRAADNGVVAYAGNELRGFGNLLLIKHADGWISAYAHNERILVKRGDRITKGQAIAKVGSSGTVTKPQLHFELRKGRKTVDPRKHLPDQGRRFARTSTGG